MNIKEAREEIIRTVRTYTAKDENGYYRIPSVRQRPVLLMGPPGIGKTAIMEQAAAECGVGLVAYTITHHTRQSAVGLPQIAVRQYAGKEYAVTEYTMSEIVGTIYETMERTGCKEGILFVDEINCVSETLAPTMLQFLQYKTFGNHKVPDGWVIVAAGNPSEFNKSVREMDMAALDRVRTIHVEADLDVWKDYGVQRGVHPSILSYLEMKPAHFYKVVQTREKREFVTARGWEDLSVVLSEYERQQMPVTKAFMGEFLHEPKIAADFAAYYELYCASMGRYRVPELFGGKLSEKERTALLDALKAARGDVKCMFTHHLLAAASVQMENFGYQNRYVKRKQEVLAQLQTYLGSHSDEPAAEGFFENRAHALQVKKKHGLIGVAEVQLEWRVDEELRKILLKDCHMEDMPDELEALEHRRSAVCAFLDQAVQNVRYTCGENLELADFLHGIRVHGDFSVCGYKNEAFEELLDQRTKEKQLQRQMTEMEELYETADCI